MNPKSVHDILRDRLLAKAGLIPSPPPKWTLAMLETQWSEKFETYMRNRLMMGALRYGGIHGGSDGYDNITSAVKRLMIYNETGNQEHLVDAANLCMVEFLRPFHPKPFFEAADDTNHKTKTTKRK